MAFTVKFKELGMTKPVSIEQTNKNMKLTLELQKKIIKSNEVVTNEEADMLETFEALEELIDIKTEYLIQVLHLDAKSIEKLADLSRDVTEDIISELVDGFFGITEEENGEDEGKE